MYSRYECHSVYSFVTPSTVPIIFGPRVHVHLLRSPRIETPLGDDTIEVTTTVIWHNMSKMNNPQTVTRSVHVRQIRLSLKNYFYNNNNCCLLLWLCVFTRGSPWTVSFSTWTQTWTLTNWGFGNEYLTVWFSWDLGLFIC